MKTLVKSSKLKAQITAVNTNNGNLNVFSFNLKLFALSFILLAFSFQLLAVTAFAQEVNLSMDPPIVQVKIKPGKAITIAYTVENKGDPTNLQFLIRPFTPVGQLGSLTVSPQLEGPVQFNLENTDIELEKPFFFPSREKRQAVLRISIPPGIPDGDYYYMILGETVPAFALAGQSTGIASAAIGSPLLITITKSGISEVKASIAEFSFKPDWTFTVGNKTVRIVDNIKDVPIICSIRNMGNNLIQPNGTIVDRVGTSKKEYSIIPQNILSNSQRVIKVAQEDIIQANSTAVLTHLSIGYHAVSANISFGENTAVLFKELSFIALPIRLITVTCIVLGMVLVLFLIQYFRKRKHTRK